MAFLCLVSRLAISVIIPDINYITKAVDSVKRLRRILNNMPGDKHIWHAGHII
jgi:hypothetical protein